MRLTGFMKELTEGPTAPFGCKFTICRPEQANLVSSELGNGQHMPAIDIDVPAWLIESSTPGHSHLYIEVPMSWRKYRRLLKAMAKAGVVEWGYYRASKARKASYLRMPGVPKVMRAEIQRTSKSVDDYDSRVRGLLARIMGRA